MPYLVISDGAPEAEEYASDYVWYDPRDPASVQRALDLARQRGSDASVGRPATPPRPPVGERLFLPSGWLPRVVRFDRQA